MMLNFYTLNGDMKISISYITFFLFIYTNRTMAKRVINTPPINQIFQYLQNQNNVNIWLYQQNKFKITGIIKGFDEFMNLTIENAKEVSLKDPLKERVLGMIMIKGDNISLISCV